MLSDVLAAEAGVGFASDNRGNSGFYTTAGYGGGTPDSNISVVVSWSNAGSIQQLNGEAVSVNAGGGFLGHGGVNTSRAIVGEGQKPIVTGGFSIGVGAGASGSVMYTNTEVTEF